MAANRKTFSDIHHEITAAQVQDMAKAVVGFKLVQFLPTFLFSFFLWIVERYPQMGKKYRGTVELSAVGMFGKGSSWGIPPAGPTLNIIVGGIGEKPGVMRSLYHFVRNARCMLQRKAKVEVVYIAIEPI
jgi:hypothetical protein